MTFHVSGIQEMRMRGPVLVPWRGTAQGGSVLEPCRPPPPPSKRATSNFLVHIVAQDYQVN